jgi:uncharacterized protein (DUF1778 family)
MRSIAMRAAAINIRALPEQRDLIDHAASLQGKSRSDFMLEAACERAQSVVLDQVHFSLDAEKFQQFVDLLDAPPQSNAGLERLLALKPVWNKA